METIRQWRKEDIDSIIDLLYALNASLGEDQEIEKGNVVTHFQRMQHYPDIYENLVYEEDGNIIGFISILYYRSVYHRVGTALINELIVSENHRNKNIGKKLLETAIAHARQRGMDEIEVGVMKDNTNAIRFYKKNGVNEEYYLLGKEF